MRIFSVLDEFTQKTQVIIILLKLNAVFKINSEGITITVSVPSFSCPQRAHVDLPFMSIIKPVEYLGGKMAFQSLTDMSILLIPPSFFLSSTKYRINAVSYLLSL